MLTAASSSSDAEAANGVFPRPLALPQSGGARREIRAELVVLGKPVDRRGHRGGVEGVRGDAGARRAVRRRGDQKPVLLVPRDLVHRRDVVGDCRLSEGDRFIQRKTQALPSRGRKRDVGGGDCLEVLPGRLVGYPQLDPAVARRGILGISQARALDLSLDDQPRALALDLRPSFEHGLERLAPAQEPPGEDESDRLA